MKFIETRLWHVNNTICYININEILTVEKNEHYCTFTLKNGKIIECNLWSYNNFVEKIKE